MLFLDNAPAIFNIDTGMYIVVCDCWKWQKISTYLNCQSTSQAISLYDKCNVNVFKLFSPKCLALIAYGLSLTEFSTLIVHCFTATLTFVTIIDQSAYSLDLKPKYSVVEILQKCATTHLCFLLNSEFTLKTSNKIKVWLFYVADIIYLYF